MRSASPRLALSSPNAVSQALSTSRSSCLAARLAVRDQLGKLAQGEMKPPLATTKLLLLPPLNDAWVAR